MCNLALMWDLYDRDETPVATAHESALEYARNYGAEHPDVAWVMDWRDAWFPNPFYHGPPVKHPEEDDYDEVPVTGLVTIADDEIPF